MAEHASREGQVSWEKFRASAETTWNKAVAATAEKNALERGIMTPNQFQAWNVQKAIAAENFNLSAYNRLSAIGSASLANVGKNVPFIELGIAGVNVIKASSNDKIWTSVRDGGSVVVGGLGMAMGAALASPAEVVLPVASTPAVIASSMLMGSFLSETWKAGVDWVHNETIELQQQYKYS